MWLLNDAQTQFLVLRDAHEVVVGGMTRLVGRFLFQELGQKRVTKYKQGVNISSAFVLLWLCKFSSHLVYKFTVDHDQL